MNIISITALLGVFMFPSTGQFLANSAFDNSLTEPKVAINEEQVTPDANDNKIEKDNEITNDLDVVSTKKVVMTAYSSTEDQTDSSPFTMANGKRVYDGAIAANFLPFGTKVRIPELFGDKIFVVEDRMHKRFSNRVDVWMETRGQAINFGIKKDVLIEVVS